MGWDGMGWDGMGWDGMGWDRIGQDRIGQDIGKDEVVKKTQKGYNFKIISCYI